MVMIGEHEYAPRLVEALVGKKVVGAATGICHTAVWTDAGELFTFGLGDNGRLGNGGEEDEFVPRPVEADFKELAQAPPTLGGPDYGLSNIQRCVLRIIEQCGSGEMGCGFGVVQSESGSRFSEVQLREAIGFLNVEGYLYSTIYDEHFKATSAD